MEKNVMITCAITGGIHTPSLSPDLPITPQLIAHEAIAAAKAGAKAGASIIHLHASDPDKGRPSATAAQTRQRLRLKGGNSVGFYPLRTTPFSWRHRDDI